MKRFAGLLAVLMLAGALAACGRELSVSVTFEDAGPLKHGMPVFLDGVEVGEVDRATVSGDLTEVEVSLDPDLVAGLNAGSAALLSTHDGEPVILLYNYRPGQEKLQDGGELIGLHNAFEAAAWRTGEVLDSGRQSVDEMTRSMNEYFQSEEWREQKEEMNRRMEQLKEDLGQTYEETNESYRRFLENLESDSEIARERAEELYSQLAEQLREDIARLRKQGNEKLVEPLLQLLEELSRAMEKKPEQAST